MRQNDITRFIYLESYHAHYNIQLCVSYFMQSKQQEHFRRMTPITPTDEPLDDQ